MDGVTVTERNWLRAVAIVLASIALCGALAAAEGDHRAPAARIVAQPVEASMRILGIPHFILGFLFLVTSRGMQRPHAWTRLFALGLLGAALCGLFSKFDTADDRVPRLLVFAYFAVHEFRDEAHFYVANGDAPAGADPRKLSWAVLLAPLLLFWLWAGVILFGAAFGIGDHRRYGIDSLPLPLRWAVGILPFPALAVFVRRMRLRFVPTGGAALGLWRAYRPILRVCGGVVLVVLAEFLVDGRIFALVTLHVAAWYVFAMFQLGRRPPPSPAPRPFSWRWMRATRNGFTFAHAGLAAVVLAGCAVAVYGFRDPPAWYRVLISRESFLYWTIMHVTISFVPRA